MDKIRNERIQEICGMVKRVNYRKFIEKVWSYDENE